MKKMLFLGLFALSSLLGVSQPLELKEAKNALIIFQDGAASGVSTYYFIPNLKIWVDSATIGRRIEINSDINLVGFARTQQISGNIYDFISPVPIKPTNSIPSPAINPEPTYQIGRIKLDIPGYSEVSDIYLADASLKIKDPAKLDIQLATHSISLGEGLGNKRSLVNYKITDQSGKVWVEVIQKLPTEEGRLGGAFGNNHPDKQYLPQLSEDCNVFLPLGNIYTIQVENKGDLVVDFWVHFPWSSDGTERRLHREDVRSGFAYYNIDTNALGLAAMPDYQRTIKINVNGKL